MRTICVVLELGLVAGTTKLEPELGWRQSCFSVKLPSDPGR